jgi:threonine dehydrogenase-like Zn-dependent dehydrogenase
MRSGFIRASDYYSHVLPMDDVAEGVRLLEERKAFKVILTMNQKDN